jgi:hypothetical protein
MSEASAAFRPVRFTIVFHEAEDRLLVLAADGAGEQQGLVLTRRLTARLINGLAVILERSNVAASTAPDELRSDIVLMEHQGALAGTDAAAPAGEAQAQAPTADPAGTVQINLRLVTSVDIKTNPRDFHMALKTAVGEPVAVVLNRLDLHRLVELLKRQADTAGWNLQIEADWLGDDHSQLTLN